MAEVRLSGTPSLSTKTPCDAHNITGLKAGEAIPAGRFVYIAAAGGVFIADGSAADIEANAIGINPAPASLGEAITIHRGVRYRWCKKLADAGPAPGTLLYLSGTNEGELADAASTGGQLPIAFVVDVEGRIQLMGACG